MQSTGPTLANMQIHFDWGWFKEMGSSAYHTVFEQVRYGGGDRLLTLQHNFIMGQRDKPDISQRVGRNRRIIHQGPIQLEARQLDNVRT